MTSFPKPLSAKQEARYLAEMEYIRKHRPQDENRKALQNEEDELSGEEAQKLHQAAYARKQLIEHNMRLVAHIVKKYQNSEKELEDLLSIGTIGLIKAIDSFHVEKGIRLATYASRCIENEILMVFRSEKKLSRDVYLYDSVGSDKEGNDVSLIDLLEGETCDITEGLVLDEELKQLRKLFGTVLTEKEQKILRMRYGIGQREMTQKEVGKVYGISRSYVSRLEKRALEKLKKGFE